MCAASCDILSRLSSLGTITMLVAPQSIRAGMCCIVLFPSDICTSWTRPAKSSISVVHGCWIQIPALVLSWTACEFSEIRSGWTSSKVTISACTPDLMIPSSISSNLLRHARYQETHTSFLLPVCRRNIGGWFVDCCLCPLCLSHSDLWGWVYLRISAWSLLGSGRFDDCCRIVGISLGLSAMHEPPRLLLATEVDLSCYRRMTYLTCRAWMGSKLRPSLLRLMIRCYAFCRLDEMTRPVVPVGACHTSPV